MSIVFVLNLDAASDEPVKATVAHEGSAIRPLEVRGNSMQGRRHIHDAHLFGASHDF